LTTKREVTEMTQQLTVYDENGVPIGMTFPKRARQLVSKQRALWHDDAHTAIRLLPEAKEEVPLGEYLGDDDMDESPAGSRSDDLLLYLAKRNVREKRNLTKHFVAFIAAWPAIIIFYEVIASNVQRRRLHSWWDSAEWHLDIIRNYVPEESIWAVDSLYFTGRSLINSLTHPIMYGIIGIMIAWGVWIFVRCVNWAIANDRGRAGKTKPDPVQVEYRRLKDMGAGKF